MSHESIGPYITFKHKTYRGDVDIVFSKRRIMDLADSFPTLDDLKTNTRQSGFSFVSRDNSRTRKSFSVSIPSSLRLGKYYRSKTYPTAEVAARDALAFIAILTKQIEYVPSGPTKKKVPLLLRAKTLGVDHRLKTVCKAMSRHERNKIHSWNNNVVTAAGKKRGSESDSALQTVSFNTKETAVVEVEAFEIETDDICASASQPSSMTVSSKRQRSDEDEIDFLVKNIKAAESLGDGPMVARLKLKLENM